MAFCTKCGKQLNEDAAFCPACGTPVVHPQSQQTQWTQPSGPAANDDESTSILVFGILSLALGTVPAIIFGSLAKKKANAYIASGKPLVGKAKVGYTLGKIGFILGIASAALATLIGIIWGVAAGATLSYYF